MFKITRQILSIACNWFLLYATNNWTVYLLKFCLVFITVGNNNLRLLRKEKNKNKKTNKQTNSFTEKKENISSSAYRETMKSAIHH